MASMQFVDTPPLSPANLFLGIKSLLVDEAVQSKITSLLNPLNVSATTVQSAIKSLSPGDFDGADITLQLPSSDPSVLHSVTFAATSTTASRHNCVSRPDQALKLSRGFNSKPKTSIFLVVSDENQAFTLACAVARAFPLYTQKNLTKPKVDKSIQVGFITTSNVKIDLARVQSAANAVRFAARLVDTPTSEMFTTTMVEEAKKAVQHLSGVTVKVIQGEELKSGGFGGLWGVGKAAVHPPSLVVMSYTPENAKKNICLVGKGIVYDTGGLNIKVGEGMPGMKRDMGGAAAVLASFVALVENKTPHTIHGLLCLAENSVGPESTRPDDILYMYSGKTVEVNNTDAEGRLVLADGVHYATKHLNPDILLDIATLTGGQGVATGVHHAAIVCNEEEIETITCKAGRASGDLVFPLVFTPELHMNEFNSAVADMKNSVANRSNAISSCAACFIYQHLHEAWKGKWVHVDIARPSYQAERATGFGVGLIMELFK